MTIDQEFINQLTDIEMKYGFIETVEDFNRYSAEIQQLATSYGYERRTKDRSSAMAFRTELHAIRERQQRGASEETVARQMQALIKLYEYDWHPID